MKNPSLKKNLSKTTFGMIMSERSFSSEKYRYGFNSQEKDDEVAGSGNINTAEYWEYDCRLGRRWNVDPLAKSYEGSYVCLYNSPIIVIDPSGESGYVDKDGKYLGDDGNKDDKSTKVFKGSQDDWNKIVGEKGYTKEQTIEKLRESSINLKDYSEGIIITDAVWKEIKDGGTGENKVNPWLHNYSDHTVYYKPEGTDEAFEVGAHKDVYRAVDGVAAPHLNPRNVYKVGDENVVNITNTGIDTYITGAWSGLAKKGNDWLDEGWLRDASSTYTEIEIYNTNANHQEIYHHTERAERIRKNVDRAWINLFVKSGVTDANKYRNPHAHGTKGKWTINTY